MFGPRKNSYGQSTNADCLFCSNMAVTKNDLDIPVCKEHKDAVLNDFKCFCGDYLDVRIGKFGVFFSCFKCGNVSLSKALEINTIQDVSKKRPVQEHKKEESQYNTNKAYLHKVIEQKESKKTTSKVDDFFTTYIPDESSGKETTVRSDDPRYFS